MNFKTFFISISLIFSLTHSSCGKNTSTLKKVFNNDFKIGASVNANWFPKNDPALSIVRKHFNSIVAENSMKWDHINPRPGVYTFEKADKIVNFAQKNNLDLVGHVLFWDQQMPKWAFKGKNGKQASKELLLKRMRNHVKILANRYKDKITTWDVVNEALENDGSIRKEKDKGKKSQWYNILGDNWIIEAFKIANELLPKKVELVYNDYGMYNNKKVQATIKLVKKIRAAGGRINGVGLQAHWGLNYPSIKEINYALYSFSQLGVNIHISELDVDVLPHPKRFGGGANITDIYKHKKKLDPYRNGLPHEMQKKLSDRYVELFTIFRKYAHTIKRVNLWGVTDKYTWKNNWPVIGRKNHPLLFDRNYKAKPAFYSLIRMGPRKITNQPQIQTKQKLKKQ